MCDSDENKKHVEKKSEPELEPDEINFSDLIDVIEINQVDDIKENNK